MKKFLIFVISIINTFTCLAQLTNNCLSALPICSTTSYNFPLATGITAEVGPNYGCLLTQLNPTWFYMKIVNPGNISLYIQSTPGVYNIDFICWGPFTSSTNPCTFDLTSENIVGCSYSTSDQENCNISNVLTGQFYILMITNTSNLSTNVFFTQINNLDSNAASLDCSPLQSQEMVFKDNNKELLIYPNPVNDKIEIQGISNGTMEIINIQGQVLKTYNISNTKVMVDISMLSSGVYTIRIITKDGINVKKLIKQ